MQLHSSGLLKKHNLLHTHTVKLTHCSLHSSNVSNMIPGGEVSPCGPYCPIPRGAARRGEARCNGAARRGPTRHTVGFHNFNLRIFNLRVSNPNKLIVDVFFDTMSDFNVPGSRPKETRWNFGNRPQSSAAQTSPAQLGPLVEQDRAAIVRSFAARL